MLFTGNLYRERHGYCYSCLKHSLSEQKGGESFGGTFITQAVPSNGAELMDFTQNGSSIWMQKHVTAERPWLQTHPYFMCLEPIVL